MNLSYVKCVCCGLLLSGALCATPMLQSSDTANTSADNTKVNKRDRKQSEPTADNAKNRTSDRELMRQIRRDVVADKTLSAYSHNVKIIAQQGKVTLKGVVHTEDEKKAIEDLARKHAGDGNVTNDILVKGDNDNSAPSK
jgi:hyperosmotically inducible periplasmic protein